MKAFKVIGNIIKGLSNPQKVLQGATVPNFKTIASKKGVINYNPTGVDYSNFSKTESNKVFVYPTTDLKDQEHYILFDINNTGKDIFLESIKDEQRDTKDDV